MRRRDFLRASGGALGLALGSLAACRPTPAPSAALLEAATLGTVADEATIVEIGRAYLAANPKEASRSRLVRALLRVDQGGLVSQDDPDRLRTFLGERIHADFEAGRTVVVDGWYLAASEARQAALLSLTE